MQARGMPAYCCIVLKMCRDLSMKMLLDTLVSKNYIDKDYNPTKNGKDLIAELYGSAEKSTMALLGLYNKMRELFPKGNKPGTNTSWRGNPTNVINKLNKFFANYGDATEEEILQATENYVNSFKRKNSYAYMRVLPYFISKLEDGEEKSNLADEIMKLRDGDTEEDLAEDTIKNDYLEVDNLNNLEKIRLI